MSHENPPRQKPVSTLNDALEQARRSREAAAAALAESKKRLPVAVVKVDSSELNSRLIDSNDVAPLIAEARQRLRQERDLDPNPTYDWLKELRRIVDEDPELHQMAEDIRTSAEKKRAKRNAQAGFDDVPEGLSRMGVDALTEEWREVLGDIASGDSGQNDPVEDPTAVISPRGQEEGPTLVAEEEGLTTRVDGSKESTATPTPSSERSSNTQPERRAALEKAQKEVAALVQERTNPTGAVRPETLSTETSEKPTTATPSLWGRWKKRLGLLFGLAAAGAAGTAAYENMQRSAIASDDSNQIMLSEREDTADSADAIDSSDLRHSTVDATDNGDIEVDSTDSGASTDSGSSSDSDKTGDSIFDSGDSTDSSDSGDATLDSLNSGETESFADSGSDSTDSGGTSDSFGSVGMESGNETEDSADSANDSGVLKGARLDVDSAESEDTGMSGETGVNITVQPETPPAPTGIMEGVEVEGTVDSVRTRIENGEGVSQAMLRLGFSIQEITQALDTVEVMVGGRVGTLRNVFIDASEAKGNQIGMNIIEGQDGTIQTVEFYPVNNPSHILTGSEMAGLVHFVDQKPVQAAKAFTGSTETAPSVAQADMNKQVTAQVLGVSPQEPQQNQTTKIEVEKALNKPEEVVEEAAEGDQETVEKEPANLDGIMQLHVIEDALDEMAAKGLHAEIEIGPLSFSLKPGASDDEYGDVQVRHRGAGLVSHRLTPRLIEAMGIDLKAALSKDGTASEQMRRAANISSAEYRRMLRISKGDQE